MKKHTCRLDHHQKISLRHDWTKEKGEIPLGSTVDQQPEERSCSTVTRRSCQTSQILPTNQPIPKPICDRSGQP